MDYVSSRKVPGIANHGLIRGAALEGALLQSFSHGSWSAYPRDGSAHQPARPDLVLHS